MLKDKKVGFIGGGQISEALLCGALTPRGLAKENVTVCDTNSERLVELAARYGVQIMQNDAENTGVARLLAQCDAVILAVKPQHAAALLQSVGSLFTQAHTIFSVVGGFTLEMLEKAIPAGAVLRVMPNTPMQVG